MSDEGDPRFKSCKECGCIRLRHRFYAATSACECGKCPGWVPEDGEED